MITLAMIKWGLTALSIIGAALNANRQPLAGHLVWLVANAGWLVAWQHQGEAQAAVLFAGYLSITMFGCYQWAR